MVFFVKCFKNLGPGLVMLRQFLNLLVSRPHGTAAQLGLCPVMLRYRSGNQTRAARGDRPLHVSRKCSHRFQDSERLSWADSPTTPRRRGISFYHLPCPGNARIHSDSPRQGRFFLPVLPFYLPSSDLGERAEGRNHGY